MLDIRFLKIEFNQNSIKHHKQVWEVKKKRRKLNLSNYSNILLLVRQSVSNIKKKKISIITGRL